MMMAINLAEDITARFHETRILIVGDLMLDTYTWGSVDRISPEAPVPVVQVTRESEHLGGAGNVANNIKALTGIPVPIGFIGNDEAGHALIRNFEERGIDASGLIKLDHYQTPHKTRIIAGRQQVVRVDRECSFTPNAEDCELLIQRIHSLAPGAHATLISDYGKGSITPGLLEQLTSKKITPWTFVDPKDRNFSYYRHVDILTPNKKEAERMAGMPIHDDESLTAAAHKIFSDLECRELMITLGDQGLALFENADKFIKIKARAQQVSDVSGAGDTVISVYALARASGRKSFEAAALANVAAGVIVSKLGTATLDLEELHGACH